MQQAADSAQRQAERQGAEARGARSSRAVGRPNGANEGDMPPADGLTNAVHAPQLIGGIAATSSNLRLLQSPEGAIISISHAPVLHY